MGDLIPVFQLIFGILYYFSVILSKAQISNYDSYYEDAKNFNSSNYFIDFEPLYSDVLVEDIDLKSINKRRESVDSGLNNETKIKILDLHNLYRSNVTPPAGNMNFLEWDDQLEHLAQLWAETCEFKHGKPKNTSYHSIYGQNLYMGTDPTGILGVWMWYDEYHNYEFHNKTCIPGKQCGHYLTMAWADSNKIGCAMTRCGFRYYLVCHYSPSVLKGLQIYDVSRPCSQCAIKEGTLCYNNLCMTREQCESNPEKCKLAECRLKCHNCGILDRTECLCTCADGWDSYDCSRLCADAHDRCGKKPGFPNKATCSLNKYAVGNVYCRKMCEKCHPVMDNTKINHLCCEGRLCPNGYVLDMDRKPCRCTRICPGPKCDVLDGGGVMFKSNISLLFFIALVMYFIENHL